jgi:integrase
LWYALNNCRRLPVSSGDEDLAVNALSNHTLVAAPEATTATGAHTAADAIRAVTTWTDLPERRRRDLRAALGVLERASGRPLDLIALEPEAVRDLLGRATAAALRISDGTLRTYRSGLLYILGRLGLIAQRSQPAEGLPPIWSDLLDRLPDRYWRMSLVGCARFCAARSVAPEEVDDAVLQAFAEHLRNSDIRITAWVRARRAGAAWNRAVDTIPGWPPQRIGDVQTRQRRYSLPFNEYPATLQEEIARFAARLGSVTPDGRSSLFTGDGPPVPLRPAAIGAHLAALRLALAALVHSGTVPERVTSLAFLVEHRRTALDWHFMRAGKRPTHTTSAIASVLNIIAKYEIRLTGEALRVVLADLRRAHPPKQREMTGKNANRLRELEDPAREAALLHLPARLMPIDAKLRDDGMHNAGSATRTSREAWLASIAVAIEILLHCPLRLTNLTGLRIGVHLRFSEGRVRRPTHIVVEPDEVKNGTRIEWPLERAIADLIARYISVFRPLIARPGSDWLFPSRDHSDRPRDKTTFSTAITDTIHEHVGVPMNPHLFRAFAGALILAENPHAIDDLRAVLGHRGFETALIHYRAVSARGAAQRLNGIVAGKRAATRSGATAAFTGPHGQRRRRAP